MSDKPAIIVDHVSMKFNLSKEKVDSLKDYVIKMIKGQIQYNEFWALKDVTFTVNKGDRVGILGLNGAGKSTLLKVISGVFKPTEGTVTKNGKIVPLLELGAGFDPQYTGQENIFHRFLIFLFMQSLPTRFLHRAHLLLSLISLQL